MQEAYGRADPAPDRATDPAGRPPIGPDAVPTVMDPAHLTDRSNPNDICPFFRAEHARSLGATVRARRRGQSLHRRGWSAAPVRAPAGTGVPDRRARQLPPVPPGRGQSAEGRRSSAGQARPLDAGRSRSALALVAAAALSVGFLLVRGDMTVPVASVAPSTLVAASPAVESPLAVAPPEPTATPAPTAFAERDGIGDARSRRRRRRLLRPRPRPDATANERPIRVAGAVPGHEGLLDLHRPIRRQPPEHRQLLRNCVRDGARHEPADRGPDDDSGGRPDPHAAPDPLTWPASTSGASTPSRSTATGP